MGEVLIGTSGYSYRDWVGPVYPAGSPSGDFLRLYSQRFRFVELNFSYYRMPEADLLKGMQRTVDSFGAMATLGASELPAAGADTGSGDLATPGAGTGFRGFRFAIKGHRSLTHERPGGEKLQRDAEAFRRGVSPLLQAGSLAAVVLQFPYSFHYTDENRRYLDALCMALADLPLVVEFRSLDWLRGSVALGLRDRGAGLVAVDAPSLPGLPGAEVSTDLALQAADAEAAGPNTADPMAAATPNTAAPTAVATPDTAAPTAVATPDTAAPTAVATLDTAAPSPVLQTQPGAITYVRFHGRNSETWWEGTNVTRYDYRYSDTELSEWVPRIRALQGASRILLIAFNNHAAGKAVQAAERLQQLLMPEKAD
ncbi:DUF72 domain-containing protein [Spirochaeta africana]|uniref:DUF72 domain-containing protein n=1 Tax=Spirochaeta africana (strain ATCC 700263 / DSM 8902 / Z-7692) TaxID=889378 RepID=H9UHM7_SPIAZ|nr:DUF72 domain-containing protein [Spirochaeta africana]AFG37020.1 hypothetical protein Spiaf_0931 [Spirochaeta africana DSM 8902]